MTAENPLPEPEDMGHSAPEAQKIDAHQAGASEGYGEGGAGQRRQVDGLAFHQDRLECLNTQTVQRVTDAATRATARLVDVGDRIS